MAEPVLTSNGSEDLDAALIVNGSINILRTHPNLYWMVTTLGVVNLLLAANFFVLHPTFELYHFSNWIWGAAFLMLGVAKLGFLNLYRNLRAIKMTMGIAISYILFLGIGACEPWLDGEGSLQLPILYLGLAAIQFPMALEPFLNPFTARRQ